MLRSANVRCYDANDIASCADNESLLRVCSARRLRRSPASIGSAFLSLFSLGASSAATFRTFLFIMGSLLIFLGICLVFGAFPALIVYAVVAASRAGKTQSPSSPVGANGQCQAPSSPDQREGGIHGGEPSPIPVTVRVTGAPIEGEGLIPRGMLVVGPILVFSGVVLLLSRLGDLLGDLLCRAGQLIVLVASLFTWNFGCQPTQGTYSGVLLFVAGLAISLFGAHRMRRLDRKDQNNGPSS